MLPAGVVVDSTTPLASSVDVSGDASGVVEWQIPNAPRTMKLRLYTHATAGLPSGSFLDNFTALDNGVSAPITVSGETMIR
jgi:hypothetical protein